MDILLDANLLTRCIQPSHPLHATATAAMKELSLRKNHLCIVPEVLYEHLVVCTRPPGEYGGLGMTSEAAVAEIARVTWLFEILPDVPAIFPQWLSLMPTILGNHTFTALLAARDSVYPDRGGGKWKVLQ